MTASRGVVGGEKPLHATSQIGLRRLEDDVQVVGEDHAGLDHPAAPPGSAAKADFSIPRFPRELLRWRTQRVTIPFRTALSARSASLTGSALGAASGAVACSALSR